MLNKTLRTEKSGSTENRTGAFILGTVLVISLGIFLLIANFLLINTPILIESETSGGLGAKIPELMLMHDRTLYRTYIDGESIRVMQSKIPQNLFDTVREKIERIQNRLKPHYVISKSFDDSDVKLYFKNQTGEQSTYIYGYATEIEDDRAPNLMNQRERLRKLSENEIIDILDELPRLRREPPSGGSELDLLVMSFWRTKQTNVWIGDIRE